MITTIILWVVLGLVMGLLARAILPGEQKIGLIPTLIVGVIGSFVGGYIGKFLGLSMGSINWQSLLAALVGSLIILIIYCLITRKNWR